MYWYIVLFLWCEFVIVTLEVHLQSLTSEKNSYDTKTNVPTKSFAQSSLILPKPSITTRIMLKVKPTSKKKSTVSRQHTMPEALYINSTPARFVSSVRTKLSPEVIPSTTAHKRYHMVNMEANFVKELDRLDEYMLNVSKFEFMCEKPRNLKYCSKVVYEVPKALSETSLFQENMAQAAVDSLSILTKGETTSCETELKVIFCDEKFPQCNELQETSKWESQTKCRHLITKCSSKARDAINQMEICEKLSKGSLPINRCIPYMHPPSKDLCNPKNVSSWLYHAGVEINALLRFQFALNNKLTSDCKNSLSSYLCYTGLQCHLKDDIVTYKSENSKKCQQAIKKCAGQTLSGAIKDLFLKCN